MIIVYVAGPYRSKWGFIGRMINVLKSHRVSKQMWKIGLYPIDPLKNTLGLDGVASDDHFIDGDLLILENCDCIYMRHGWERSEGARTELQYAEEAGMEVFYEDDTTSMLELSIYAYECRSHEIDIMIQELQDAS